MEILFPILSLEDPLYAALGRSFSLPVLFFEQFCFFRNLSDVLDAGLSQYPYKYYTLQHYPTHICNGPNAKNTNITYFVSHANGES